MRASFFPLLAVVVSLSAFPAHSHSAEPSAASSGRERVRLDADWRFALGHATDPAQDFGYATGFFSYLAKTGFGDGPARPAFEDRAWRRLDLPHDWAVEAPFSANASHSHGYKAVGPRFPERSIGWYRKHLAIPAADLGRRIHVDFDGVFRDARVFVNGFFVGEEPSGYAAASYDVTDYLNYGGDNVIAVRVDASMEEGWFYEGAGIYRHVWLLKTAPLHVAESGTWVRTEVAGNDATATIETTIANDDREPVEYVVEQIVTDPDGRIVAHAETAPARLAATVSATHHQVLAIPTPRLWSLDTPVLYRLTTTIRRGATVVDRAETPFGVRSIRFDPNAGFFLNGQRVEIKGTNNHQDHAGVGVALPDALQDFRIRALKAMGSNTYRTSHNPPTPELLEACDRLGMLVIDETRLMGSNEFHLRLLKQMILRDRNHPSVILWSLGNEEWGIEGNIKGARIATTMQDFAHQLDPTRSTTVAISGGWGGISTVIEVAGINYLKQAKPEDQHARFPWQVLLGTEETTTQGTRGIYVDDRAAAHLAPLEDGSSGGNAESGWRYYVARPWLAGLCYWTGFDYRGEPTPFGYPAISSQFGILDTCGFPKDDFYYLQSWWTEKPVLHVFPHWNWPGREGQIIEVRAHSNCAEVELFLNGASLGRQAMPADGHLAWAVRYAPGTLLARGYRGGREIITAQVDTTGPAAVVALTPDRPSIHADGRDLAVVTVEVRDANARVVPTADHHVTFAIRGPGRIVGVGNGDPSCHEPDRFVESYAARTIGDWHAPDPAITEGAVVFDATFDAPALAPGGSATLLLSALGPKQTVAVNGHLLFQDASPAQSHTEIALDTLGLQATGNRLHIETPRFSEWRDRESIREVQPASWRIVTPAGAWSRSVFNGLAQIIVQSTGEPGEIELSASSEGLTTAQLTVKATSP